MPEQAGRQSPPPERQSGKQQGDTPASGQGTDKIDNKEAKMNAQLDNLESNPKSSYNEALEEKFSKTQK